MLKLVKLKRHIYTICLINKWYFIEIFRSGNFGVKPGVYHWDTVHSLRVLAKLSYTLSNHCSGGRYLFRQTGTTIYIKRLPF